MKVTIKLGEFDGGFMAVALKNYIINMNALIENIHKRNRPIAIEFLSGLGYTSHPWFGKPKWMPRYDAEEMEVIIRSYEGYHWADVHGSFTFEDHDIFTLRDLVSETHPLYVKMKIADALYDLVKASPLRKVSIELERHQLVVLEQAIDRDVG